MSRMIPQRTVDALRRFVDVTVCNYGIDCELFVSNNNDSIEQLDIFKKPEDYTYDRYCTQVFIEWKPTKSKLRKLGLYTEEDLPIICWFSNKIRNIDSGFCEDVDIKIGSYFSVDTQYIPADIDSDEFEIVDVIIRGMHDKVVTKSYKIAPRRVR